MVDQKLLAGVTKTGDVADAVRDDVKTRFRKAGHPPLELLRLWYIASALTADVVLMRRIVLGLGRAEGFRMDNKDTASVFKLVHVIVDYSFWGFSTLCCLRSCCLRYCSLRCSILKTT